MPGSLSNSTAVSGFSGFSGLGTSGFSGYSGFVVNTANLTTVTGGVQTLNNYAASTYTYFNITGNKTITGIQYTFNFNRLIFVVPATAAGNVILKHNNTSSDVYSRINTGGTDLVIAPGSHIELIYDAVSRIWRLVSFKSYHWNNTLNPINFAVTEAHVKFTGNPVNIDFYQDATIRFQVGPAGTIQAALVSGSAGISFYGLETSSTTNALPISSNAAFVGKGAYTTIGTSFTTFGTLGFAADYDDLQVWWVQLQTSANKYRITVMGGNQSSAKIERWKFSSVSANTKVTLNS